VKVISGGAFCKSMRSKAVYLSSQALLAGLFEWYKMRSHRSEALGGGTFNLLLRRATGFQDIEHQASIDMYSIAWTKAAFV
jgi:hypothetical protein